MRAARQAWRRLEPVHGMIYFVPEAPERYAALGLDARAGYFASRAAAFGRASAEVVIATFYNFNPAVVRRALPAAWEKATPEQLLAARADAAGAALRRAGVDRLSGLEETLALARRAAEGARDHAQGRPLYAAHAALPWPDEPILQLWWAQTLLREFRGDGHVAVLTAEGVTPLEALVLHAATGTIPTPFLKATRAWPAAEWDATVEGLRGRGLLDGESLTTEGEDFRRHIEDRTDALALPAYSALGEDGCGRLAELARPFGRAVVDAGLLTPA
ncbi:SCO6745 family protein [Spirillospora sp. CA-142024]|uniref:SCO6745 family protein n=1 Tax=Spirillospora sp. CA-142024 TaxID=3240036 RepID=UPI003D94B62E